MPTHQQIDRFTLAFHKVALQRLREDPRSADQALAVLDRWEANGASPAGARYRGRWRSLLGGDVNRLEQIVCTQTDEAATLRSVSPLGFLLDEAERQRIRREAMAA
ncbi:MAG: hypothetical protein LCH79_14905 [Proteobacteria bacterium]|jgi:hypothetical protein|nr:hypothetical protein [Ramlibacter sp.]MCA0214453.1 hypothetical protein [Pseudomonadota bacterium]